MPVDDVRAQNALEGLRTARGHDEARQAVAAAQAAFARSPETLRGLLRAATDEPLAFPVLLEVRAALSATEAQLEARLQTALAGDPRAAVAAELARTAADQRGQPWLARVLDTAWTTLGPPSGRAAATLVDLLREAPDGPGRTTMYRFLVGKGVDVRGPLADDERLPIDSRTEVLALWAERLADAGRQKPVRWLPDPWSALAHALGNWPQHGTHPRQLFFAFRVHAALTDPADYTAALSRIAGWPLSPEVRAQLVQERAGAPVELPARSLGAGRYECARCGRPGVLATARRALDPDDPTRGLETDYACRDCGLEYHSAWELSTLDASAPPRPLAWSTA